MQAAVDMELPHGLGHNPQSRAMYGVDLMLSWQNTAEGARVMQPQILEFNFNPDTNRACKYHPHFYNDCFTALLSDNIDGAHVIPL